MADSTGALRKEPEPLGHSGINFLETDASAIDNGEGNKVAEGNDDGVVWSKVCTGKEREVICGNVLTWLDSSDEPLPGSVITGIPDIEDVVLTTDEKLPKRAISCEQRAAEYTNWFSRVADRTLARLASGEYAIFVQTDDKVVEKGGRVVGWIDKSYLCSVAAARHNCTMMWHKIAVNMEGSGVGFGVSAAAGKLGENTVDGEEEEEDEDNSIDQGVNSSTDKNKEQNEVRKTEKKKCRNNNINNNNNNIISNNSGSGSERNEKKLSPPARSVLSGHRPSYTHIVCYSKPPSTFHISQFRTPDVIDRGPMNWHKAMGLDACILCVAFLKHATTTSTTFTNITTTTQKKRVVINFFSGHGTVLAVANHFGLASMGIEIYPKRARQSAAKNLSIELNRVSAEKLLSLGMIQYGGATKGAAEETEVEVVDGSVGRSTVNDNTEGKKDDEGYFAFCDGSAG